MSKNVLQLCPKSACKKQPDEVLSDNVYMYHADEDLVETVELEG